MEKSKQRASDLYTEPSKTEHQRLALVVDDDEVNRIILEGMLRSQGFNVVLAENGFEATHLFAEHQPNIILMDIMMPVMDGYEATIKIKEMAGERFVPIIFLTAVVEEEQLAKCVKVGGDDFLSKPFSQVILMAKIEALTRMQELYSTITNQRDKIDIYNDQLLLEQKVAKRIFSRVVHEGCLDVDIFKYILSPLSIFNGDILLAAFTPSGGLNVLMGDATGHGLPAAIGAVPVSDIFYEMTDTGASVDEIVLTINAKLKAILPAEFFFCASVLNISNDFRLLTLWHGGLPDVLIYNDKNKVLTHKIPSSNFPLGVVDNNKLETKPYIIELFAGDRIYLYSDGIIEARNQDDKQFGEQRLLECFVGNIEGDAVFDAIQESVNSFRGPQEQTDDITLLEININPSLLKSRRHEIKVNTSFPQPKNWHIKMTLSPDDLRATNPVSILTKFATNNNELVKHRENIYIILSELYNNALDHGVLGLDSGLKARPEGFGEYLLLRQEGLDKLTKGFVNISIDYIANKADSGKLAIIIEDSGVGFNYENHMSKLDSNQQVFGRGIPLIKSICTELNYKGNGNTVSVLYHWNK